MLLHAVRCCVDLIFTRLELLHSLAHGNHDIADIGGFVWIVPCAGESVRPYIDKVSLHHAREGVVGRGEEVQSGGHLRSVLPLALQQRREGRLLDREGGGVAALR